MVLEGAQDKVRQHRRPYLPFDGVLVLAEEGLELERLLEWVRVWHAKTSLAELS